MMALATLTVARSLRAAGRYPALPFRVALADGRQLSMLRLLRLLPGKRLVGEAELEGGRVLAKLFVGRRCEKHWQQERAGTNPRTGCCNADGRGRIRAVDDLS